MPAIFSEFSVKWAKMKFVFTIFILIASCSKSSDNTPLSGGNSNPDFSKLIPSCYTSYSNSSIITTGDFSVPLGLTKTTWNDPHVIKAGNEFWMYASSDDNFDHDIKIYRLKSSDGINWTPSPTTPVLQRSAGQFDSQSTETPAVVFFGGQYHLFWTGYTDYNDTKTFKIGHAVSHDGITFTKEALPILEATDPNGAPNLDFNQYFVAEPAPVVFDGKIYLYFTALGANMGVGTTLQVIGLTTSSDGVNWTMPVSVLEPNQVQYPRGAPDYFKGFSTPHAAVLNGKVHLFYDVVRTNAADTLFQQVKLHHAVSDDGIAGWIQDSTEIYDHSEFSWTATEIRSPSILLNNTTLMFWFAGHSSVADLGIGYSTCAL